MPGFNGYWQPGRRDGRRIAVLACTGLLALFAFVTVPGCGGSGPPSEKRLVILINGEDPFWDAVRAGMNQAASDLNVRAVMEVNDATPEGQINKLRQFASQSGIAAVAISATDAANAAIVDAMRNLQRRGIHVITIDSDIDRNQYHDARSAFVGTDNLAGGRELGRAVRQLVPEGGTYVTFVGRTGAQNAIERVGGFAEGAGEGFTRVDNMGDENARDRARENVRTAIRNHPDLRVLVGIWAYNAPAIVDVVRDMQVRDRFQIAVFDADSQAIEAMGAGDIDVMLIQNPYEMGYQSVRMLKALVDDDQEAIRQMFPQWGEPDGEIYDTGLRIVVPDEGSPLDASLFGEQTEFFRLGEFRAWLEQHGLRSS